MAREEKGDGLDPGRGWRDGIRKGGRRKIKRKRKEKDQEAGGV
jgi:hypothetical protein